MHAEHTGYMLSDLLQHSLGVARSQCLLEGADSYRPNTSFFVDLPVCLRKFLCRDCNLIVEMWDVGGITNTGLLMSKELTLLSPWFKNRKLKGVARSVGY